MLLLLLLFLSASSMVTAGYTLSDIQYDVPHCMIQNVSLSNDFGGLTIVNDLMGETLGFSVKWNDAWTACRLCQISPDYCTTMNSSESRLQLAQDTQYNLRVISVSEKETTIATSFLLKDGEDAHLRASNLCGRVRRMVIEVMANIQSPMERDFMLIASDESHSSLPCNGSDLSCQTRESFFFIDYSVNNCVAENSYIPVPDLSPTLHYTPLYYYYEAIVMNESTALGDERLRICGESWISLYRRTKLHELYCHYYNPLYVKPKAWYEAALLLSSAWLNGNRGVEVWIGLEALERTCQDREREVIYEESLFYNLTMWMYEDDDPVFDRTTLCEWIQSAGIDTTQSNISLPFFAKHNVHEGLLSLYLYIVEPRDSMPGFVGFSFALPFFIALVLLLCLLLTLYHIYFRQAREETSYELVQ